MHFDADIDLIDKNFKGIESQAPIIKQITAKSKRKSFLNGDISVKEKKPLSQSVKEIKTQKQIEAEYYEHIEEYIESIIMWHNLCDELCDDDIRKNFADDVLCI